MNASGLFCILTFSLIIEGLQTFDESFIHKWEFVPICKTYNFMDGSGCHPCAMEKCHLIRIRTNIRCQIFTCVVAENTLATSTATTISTKTTTTSTTSTTTLTTTTTLTITTSLTKMNETIHFGS